jgi:hypothetical protein
MKLGHNQFQEVTLHVHHLGPSISWHWHLGPLRAYTKLPEPVNECYKISAQDVMSDTFVHIHLLQCIRADRLASLARSQGYHAS